MAIPTGPVQMPPAAPIAAPEANPPAVPPAILAASGETVDELEAAFKEAVDDYLETCVKLGEEPNKPYSGKLTLRIPPSVHAAIATAAETSGKSLNKWVSEILKQATHTH